MPLLPEEVGLDKIVDQLTSYSDQRFASLEDFILFKSTGLHFLFELKIFIKTDFAQTPARPIALVSIPQEMRKGDTNFSLTNRGVISYIYYHWRERHKVSSCQAMGEQAYCGGANTLPCFKAFFEVSINVILFTWVASHSATWAKNVGTVGLRGREARFEFLEQVRSLPVATSARLLSKNQINCRSRAPPVRHRRTRSRRPSQPDPRRPPAAVHPQQCACWQAGLREYQPER